MAFDRNPIAKIDVQDANEITITHGRGTLDLGVILVIDGEISNNLIQDMFADDVDPNNILRVVFTQTITQATMLLFEGEIKAASTPSTAITQTLNALGRLGDAQGKLPLSALQVTSATQGDLLRILQDGSASWEAFPTLSHQSLADLGADDHPQYLLRSERNAADGYAGLDSGGKIPATLLPASALPEFHVVTTLTERNALTVQEGDEAYVTSLGTFYIYDGSSWITRINASDRVSGPSSVTSQRLARFDGTTGKVIDAAVVGIDDQGNVINVRDLAMSGNLNVGGNITVTGTVDGVDLAALETTTSTHVANTNNPHEVSLDTILEGTLATLNTKITDATLDDYTNPRPPIAHAANHRAGGSDELRVQQLSSSGLNANEALVTNESGGITTAPLPIPVTDHAGLQGLANDDHLQYLPRDGARAMQANLDMGGNALTNVSDVNGIILSSVVDSINTHTSNTNNPHGVTFEQLPAITLATLSGLITDATLDASGTARPPTSHASTHAVGGSDALTLDTLSSGNAPAGKLYMTNGAGGLELIDRDVAGTVDVFSACYGGGAANLTATYQGVPLTTENSKTSAFTHTTNADFITIQTTGMYVVMGYATLDKTSGGTRAESQIRVTRDTGGGYGTIPGMEGIIYNRTSGQGAGACHVSQILTLNAGTKLRLEARRVNSNDTTILKPNACGLVLHSLKGIKGEKGDPGEGSSVAVEANAEPRGSVSTLDFRNQTVQISGSRAIISRVAPRDEQVTQSNQATQTSTSYVLVPGMQVSVQGAAKYMVHFSTTCDVSDERLVYFEVRINGTAQAGTRRFYRQARIFDSSAPVSLHYLTPTLQTGDTISIFWRVDGGTGTVHDRTLTVLER